MGLVLLLNLCSPIDSLLHLKRSTLVTQVKFWYDWNAKQYHWNDTRKLFCVSGLKEHSAKLHSVGWGLLTRCRTQLPERSSPDTASGTHWNVFGCSTYGPTSECRWSLRISSGKIFRETSASCSCASLSRSRQTSWRHSALLLPVLLLQGQQPLLPALPPHHTHPQETGHSGHCRQCSDGCPCHQDPFRPPRVPGSCDRTSPMHLAASDVPPPAPPPLQETGPPPPPEIFSSWHHQGRRLTMRAPYDRSPSRRLGRCFLRTQWDTPDKDKDNRSPSHH